MSGTSACENPHIHATPWRCIETMDLPATYKASVAVRIMMDLDAAGIGVHWKERQGAKKAARSKAVFKSTSEKF